MEKIIKIYQANFYGKFDRNRSEKKIQSQSYVSYTEALESLKAKHALKSGRIELCTIEGEEHTYLDGSPAMVMVPLFALRTDVKYLNVENGII